MGEKKKEQTKTRPAKPRSSEASFVSWCGRRVPSLRFAVGCLGARWFGSWAGVNSKSKSVQAAKRQRDIWLWLKIKQQGLRGFWSMFPLTRVPFWYRFFLSHSHMSSKSLADPLMDIMITLKLTEGAQITSGATEHGPQKGYQKGSGP